MNQQVFEKLVQQYRGRKISGKYTIVEGLGFGSYGVVFLAYETLLDRFAALKRVQVERYDSAQFISEIRGLEVLKGCDRIIGYLGYETEEISKEEKQFLEFNDPIRLFLAMDVAATTLDRFIKLFGAESPDFSQTESAFHENLHISLTLIRDVLRGLEQAHEKRIIHRDIKPANIYLADDGIGRLGDFGVAKQLAIEGLDQGTIIGTTSFMSPEQLNGQQYDHRVDLFSAGVTLYRMLAGRLPFTTPMSVINDEPDLTVAGISEPMAAVLNKALAKDPKKRFSTAREMSGVVQDLYKSEGINETEMRKKIGELVAKAVPPQVQKAFQERESDPRPKKPTPVRKDPDATVVSPQLGGKISAPVSRETESSAEKRTAETGHSISDNLTAPGRERASGPSEATMVAKSPVREKTRVESDDETPPEERTLQTPLIRTPSPTPPRMEPPPSLTPKLPTPRRIAQRRESPAKTPVIPSKKERKSSIWIAAAAVVLALAVVAGVLWFLLKPNQRSLYISSLPDLTAEVFIDGRPVKTIKGSGKVLVPQKEFTLKLTAPGKQAVETKIGADTPSYKVPWIDEVLTGALVLEVNIKDVKITLDGSPFEPDSDPVESGSGWKWKKSGIKIGPHAIKACHEKKPALCDQTDFKVANNEPAPASLTVPNPKPASLTVTAEDQDGKKLKPYQLSINGKTVKLDGKTGKAAAEFETGDVLEIESSVKGYIPSPVKQKVSVDKEDTVLTLKFQKEIATPSPEAPPGESKTVKVIANGQVYINQSLCGKGPTACTVKPTKTVSIFVADYINKAGSQTYSFADLPDSVTIDMVLCNGNIYIECMPPTDQFVISAADGTTPKGIDKTTPVSAKLRCGKYMANCGNGKSETIWVTKNGETIKKTIK